MEAAADRLGEFRSRSKKFVDAKPDYGLSRKEASTSATVDKGGGLPDLKRLKVAWLRRYTARFSPQQGALTCASQDLDV